MGILKFGAAAGAGLILSFGWADVGVAQPYRSCGGIGVAELPGGSELAVQLRMSEGRLGTDFISWHLYPMFMNGDRKPVDFSIQFNISQSRLTGMRDLSLLVSRSINPRNEAAQVILETDGVERWRAPYPLLEGRPGPSATAGVFGLQPGVDGTGGGAEVIRAFSVARAARLIVRADAGRMLFERRVSLPDRAGWQALFDEAARKALAEVRQPESTCSVLPPPPAPFEVSPKP